MTNTSLLLTKDINATFAAAYQELGKVAHDMGVNYLVIGATARDLVMHHCYGAEIKRATRDVDFAINIPDWQTFKMLTTKLADIGYRETRQAHRLISPSGLPIDIVPFGDIENEDRNIDWPPNGDISMSALGFSEACQDADQVIISKDPQVIIPVASPAGMTLLKLVAWLDRPTELREKDAQDLTYLCESYEKVPKVKDAIYEKMSDALERVDWDITQVAAYCLGIEAATLAEGKTKSFINALFENEDMRNKRTRLAQQMDNDVLFNALRNGFSGRAINSKD